MSVKLAAWPAPGWFLIRRLITDRGVPRWAWSRSGPGLCNAPDATRGTARLVREVLLHEEWVESTRE